MRALAFAALAATALTAGVSVASAATVSFSGVQFPGTGAPLSVTGSDGTVFTFTAGSSSQFQSTQSGGIGAFPAGSYFLSPGLGNTTPINIAFSSALTAFSIPVSTDRVGDSPFTTTVNLFNGATLANTSTQSGNVLNGPLTFAATGLFTSASISTLANSPFGYTQNLGSITYTSRAATAVPGPIAGAGLIPLAGLGAVWFARRRRERVAA